MSATPREMIFGYYINLDERGDFYADVRGADGETVFEIRSNDDGEIEAIEDGFMRHKTDLDGLRAWLIDLDVLPEGCELLSMEDFEEALEDDRPEI